MKLFERRISCQKAGFVVALAIVAGSVAGCGSNGMMNTAASDPVPGQSTSVTVLLSSTANDQLANFQMSLANLTLTDENGKAVTVFNLNPKQLAESIHSNSVLEPMEAVSIPQGVYTSAALTFANPQFTYVTYAANDIYFNTGLTFTGDSPQPAVVNLPSPITISGNAMGLVLDSRVSQSVTMSGNPQGDDFSTSITPTFTITPENITPGATTALNGMETGLFGQITSTGPVSSDANSLVLTTPGGSSLTLKLNGATAYQGVDGYSDLASGMFADVDLAIQQDGSLLATRVEVADKTARDLVTGPVFNPNNQAGTFNLVGEREEGDDFTSEFRSGGLALRFTGDTSFRIFGGFTAAQSLPFAAVFDRARLAPGQDIAITAASIPTTGPFPVVSTATLIPQTVDGTISSVNSSGAYTIYAVTLASYDPLTPPGEASTLNVYAGSSTQMLNSAPAAVGSILRFHGLVFNDRGTLRMVCDEATDGVSE
jgi:hypothetical protein